MGETAILSGETAESRHGQEDDSGSGEERGAADRHHVAGERRVATSGHDSAAYADEHTLADLRGRYVGTVFQNPAHALNPVMTVAQQIALPLRLHYDLTKAERAERVNTMLDKVGLDRDVAGTYPHELSGGQQQRVGIATALITSPRFIIADEPTTALDSITQRQIVDLLTSLVDDAGASMLFITHDFSVLARATTRCYVLDAGRIVESGPTADLLAAPTTPQAQRLVAAAQTLTLHTPKEDSHE
nr:ATP-binding cassette domain-containing protein [Bifidobacterium longum]